MQPPAAAADPEEFTLIHALEDPIMLTRFHDFPQVTPFPFDELRRRFERAFDEVERAPSAQRGTPRFAVKESAESFLVTADVPGLSEKDVEVTIEGDVLTVKGERKAEQREGYAAHRRERETYRFAQSFRSPVALDAETSSATVQHGVLTVKLAKAKSATPRQIPVRAGLGAREENRDSGEADMEANQTTENRAESVDGRPFVAPPVDIFEGRDDILVVADVPGAAPDSITVHAEKGELLLEARTADRDAHYRRTFVLPQGIDATGIEASLRNGVLSLRLPKSQALKPRRIEVRAG